MKSFLENILKTNVSVAIILLIFLSNVTIAQTDCTNLGFEQGNFEGWDLGVGCKPEGKHNPGNGTVNFGHCCDQTQVDKFQQCCVFPSIPVRNDASITDWDATHTMCTRGMIDSLSGFEVVPPNIPNFPATNFSIRLGNARNKGQAEMIERKIRVTQDNALIAFQFAFVMNDPADNVEQHGGAKGLPYFEIKVYEGADTANTIPCSVRRFNSSQGANVKDGVPDPNYPDYTWVENMKLTYTDWEIAFVDLTDKIGEEVTLRVTNTDCSLGGHFGYTYFSAFCKEFIPMVDATICAGDSVVLTSPYPIIGYDLVWSTGQTTEQITVKPGETTIITLKATNKTAKAGEVAQCTKELKVNITVLGSTIALEDKEICAGQTATLVAEPQGEVYEWYDALTGGNLLHTGDAYTTPPLTQDTKYYVITTSQDCPPADRTEVTVTVIPSPIPAFTPNPPKAEIDNPVFVFEDESQMGVTGTWDFGDGTKQDYEVGVNPTHSYFATNDGEGPFKYDITLCLQNDLGCEECVTHPIEIMNLWSIYIPNSFTPNGDGVNEFFQAYGIGILEFDMRVYNRWGEVVFRSDDMDKGWDGTPISGNGIKQDVYVWKVRAKNNRGKVLKYIGHVSLLQ